MDERVKAMIEREESKIRSNRELSEKHRRILRKGFDNFDYDGKQHIIYENEEMINKFEDELYENVVKMNKLANELKSKVQHTEKKLVKHDVDKIQKRVEVLNQQIRILESTIRHIKN